MLDHISIKSKLWVNFTVMALGVFFISLVTVLQMLQFKDILHELLYVAGRQNVDYKHAQHLLAQLEGYFHLLRSAEDRKALTGVEVDFNRALNRLDLALTNMNQIAKVPAELLESGKVFNELFGVVLRLKATNIELEIEKKRLLDAIARIIGHDKRALATILDNNELTIFHAQEALKSSRGDATHEAQRQLRDAFAPFKSGLDIVNHFNELEILATRAGAISDPDFLAPLREKMLLSLQPIERHLQGLAATLNGEDGELLRQVQLSMQQLQTMLLGDTGILERQRMIAEAHGEYDRVLQTTISTIASIGGQAEAAAESIDTDAKQLGERTTTVLGSIVNSVGVVFLVLLAVGGMLSLFVIRSVVRPLDQGVSFAQAIAAGNLGASLQLDRSDEVGTLAAALNDMAGKLRRSDWLRTGKAMLSDRLRGEQDLKALVNNALGFIAGYVDAQFGSLYVYDPEEDSLRLTGGYAVLNPEKLPLDLRLGQGLVGQAALDRKPLTLENAPEDYPLVGSSLGALKATCFHVIPLISGDVVRAVIELGCLHSWTEQQKTFLAQIEESLAIAIETAQSRDRVRRLLQRTQDQAGKLASQQRELRVKNDALEAQTRALRESESSLQQQQEELRVTNEELEEQTRALKEHQTTLQAQQEELRVANEELAERTRELELQRDAVQKKNKELVQAQIEIERKAEEVEQASKYKSEFMANMSHELRTPLNSILILSQVLASNKADNLTDKQLEYAKTIQSSGVDLLALINEILDLAKVEAGKMQIHPEDIRLTELSENLSRIFQPMAAKKDLLLTMDIDAELPPFIHADPQRLHQVLRNLLSNAIKFTEQGGVSLRIHRPEPGLVLHTNGLLLERTVAFTVKDTGVGIEEDKQSLIFEAFQQADGATTRKYGGTGLGLSIAREMAHLLGGEIRMQSKEGEGSSFTLYAPCLEALEEKKASAPGAEGDRPAAPKPWTSQETRVLPEAAPVEPVSELASEAGDVFVPDDRRRLSKDERSLLIIGDDKSLCEQLRDIAHERGFKVLVADSGDTGLHFADYYTPSAIMIDLSLPAQDAERVMDRLKESVATRHIPVHAVSASDAQSVSAQHGAIGFLKKPLRQDELEQAFKRIEELAARPLKRLLLVEDNEAQLQGLVELLGAADVQTATAPSAEQAYAMLREGAYDCMVLDLSLAGEMNGQDFLAALRDDPSIPKLPVIVYTGRELSKQEEAQLTRNAESIIIKGKHAPERLLNEARLFLRRVEAELPSEKRRELRMVLDREAAFKDKTVLLVDDDMRNVFALASALEEKGVRVIEAGDGNECLAQLADREDVNLVLMDIMMPEMDGYETIRRIREIPRYSKTPIIALTAKAMRGDKAKCIEAGANEYLAKPVEMGKLLSLLRVWLHP
jgi:tubulin-specific chaperone A